MVNERECGQGQVRRNSAQDIYGERKVEICPVRDEIVVRIERNASERVSRPPDDVASFGACLN